MLKGLSKCWSGFLNGLRRSLTVARVLKHSYPLAKITVREYIQIKYTDLQW